MPLTSYTTENAVRHTVAHERHGRPYTASYRVFSSTTVVI
jgi:hypothetical protein